MSTEVLVYVLTALGAVVVVLTRLRLSGAASGRLPVDRRVRDLHTGSGVGALVVWTTFLVAPSDSALGGATTGIIGLACWWVLALAGLLVLLRWLPSSGKHASDDPTGSWSAGPGLSLLAHLGTVAGVAVFTWAYLTSIV